MKAGARVVVMLAVEYVIGVVSETEVVGFDVFSTTVRVRDRDRDVGGCDVCVFGDPRLQSLQSDLRFLDGIGHDLVEKILYQTGCAKICAEDYLDESFDGRRLCVGSSCSRLECLVAVRDSGR